MFQPSFKLSRAPPSISWALYRSFHALGDVVTVQYVGDCHFVCDARVEKPQGVLVLCVLAAGGAHGFYAALPRFNFNSTDGVL